MTGGSAIRGTKVGSGPTMENERGETAPRTRVSYWCENNHESRPSFAVDAEIPDEWECPRCGRPAGTDRAKPPSAHRTEPYKSHLAYVKERRSDADGEAILDEALRELRKGRGEPVE